MHRLMTMFVLVLLAVNTARGEDSDTLQILLQRGDSCMQQYNTFEALGHYQKAYDIAVAQDSIRYTMTDWKPGVNNYIPDDKIPRDVRLKLANCYYKRGNYRQCADLLKNVPEDSLTHEAFRQLCFSYQKQGDTDSYIYWTQQLVNRYPMDGEMVAGLVRAFAQNNQPQNGLRCGSKYSLYDMHNILVNRAMADAYFMDRNFTAALVWYQDLLEQGDSTFNTLYSTGMCYSQIEDLERAYKYLQLAFLTSGMQHYGCAYRLGVICVDTKRYEEGLGYLALARDLLKPDTTVMKAITLSQGEGYYLTEHYPEAVAAWKEHLTYNPRSIATYYNIANACAYLLNDAEQAKSYYQQFLALARKEEHPNAQLTEMISKSEEMLRKPSLRH